MQRRPKIKILNPFVLVIASFLIVILLGSLLLVMPWAQKSNNWEWNHYIDALFVATSTTCVTGLSAYSSGIGGTLTFAGQLICLILIQIGGLGFITILTFVITLFGHKLQFKDKFVLAKAVNATSLNELTHLVRKIILISFIIELAGFGISLPAFLASNMPVKDAVWNSVFMSVSSFNNAGFDVLGSASFINQATDGTVILGTINGGYSFPMWAYVYLLVYFMIMITLGGLSFLVIVDVFSFKKRFKQFKSFTKIVLLTSLILVVFGFICFLPLECFSHKGFTPLDAIFQSVTCRTAGIASYPQGNLTTASKIVSCFLMFVGGSPLSTAGGIKTTTLFITFLSMICYFRKKPVKAFNRRYSTLTVVKAMSLIFIGFFTTIVAFLIICGLEHGKSFNNEDILFEVYSAFGTVGLSADLTPNLSLGSKIVLCVLMFLGRLGPMTFFQVFQGNEDTQTKEHFKYVEEDFLIG